LALKAKPFPSPFLFSLLLCFLIYYSLKRGAFELNSGEYVMSDLLVLIGKGKTK